MEEPLSLPTLQPEILFQIFHKLPIKSLHQCKLVSKEWCSLISASFFKSNYNPSSIPNHPLNLMMIPSPSSHHRKGKNVISVCYEIEPTTGRPQPLSSKFASQDRALIFGSCNGLVALYRHPGEVRLFNPYLAGKEVIVHVPIDEIRYHRILYGLCYDSVNDEYKAIFCSLKWFDTHSLYVVSFKNKSWTHKAQLQIQHLDSWKDGSDPGIIVKGVPYWICRGNLGLSIFYFDSETEEFLEATKVPNGKEIFGFGVLDEKLTVTLKSDVGLEIWGLNEDGDCCWSMLFAVAYKLRSLSTLSWMIKEVEVLIDMNGEELMIYNVRDGRLRRLQSRMKRALYEIVVFVPSLISP